MKLIGRGRRKKKQVKFSSDSFESVSTSHKVANLHINCFEVGISNVVCVSLRDSAAESITAKASNVTLYFNDGR